MLNLQAIASQYVLLIYITKFFTKINPLQYTCSVMAEIIDGKTIAKKIRTEIGEEVKDLHKKKGVIPGLAVVLVGDNPASQIYVKMKAKACNEAGINSIEQRFSSDVSNEELFTTIDKLNKDPSVNGILIQLPLPDNLDTDALLKAVSPAKDVDGFHPFNMGLLLSGKPSFVPCTPFGIMKMLETIGVNPQGKDAVIVGRSNIVGKPTALLLLHKHATITLCHSRTSDIAGKVSTADILIAAIGRPEMIKGDWIKDGAVVIDVGINRLDDGTLVGDVDFKGASKSASFITPVPGGVGPMTIAMLLQNTLKAAKEQAK
jgi:methylenetetrahydrofolate dehydrogenase (NADP+)/methenyltetrahydrofolate cyclohydrolase